MLKHIVLIVLFISLFSCSKDDDNGSSTPTPVPTPSPSPSPTPGPNPSPTENTPAIPQLKTPENNAICLPNSIDFTWENKSNATVIIANYVIEIAKDNNFSTVVKRENPILTSKSFELEQNTTYFWRVKAISNDNKTSNFSAVNKFYTSGTAVENKLPLAPAITQPAINGTVAPGTTALKWTATDPDVGDILTYDVYFDKVTPPVTKIGNNISTMSINTTTITATQYYWQVVVKDKNGGITKGQIWKFKTS